MVECIFEEGPFLMLVCIQPFCMRVRSRCGAHGSMPTRNEEAPNVNFMDYVMPGNVATDRRKTLRNLYKKLI